MALLAITALVITFLFVFITALYDKITERCISDIEHLKAQLLSSSSSVLEKHLVECEFNKVQNNLEEWQQQDNANKMFAGFILIPLVFLEKMNARKAYQLAFSTAKETYKRRFNAGVISHMR